MTTNIDLVNPVSIYVIRWDAEDEAQYRKYIEEGKYEVALPPKPQKINYDSAKLTYGERLAFTQALTSNPGSTRLYFMDDANGDMKYSWFSTSRDSLFHAWQQRYAKNV